MGEEATKRLLDLKAYLEGRIKELEEEASRLRGFLEATDEALAATSFREAEAILPPTRGVEEYEETIPLKTRTGVLLANMHVGESDLKIVTGKEVTLNASIPPFQTFMVNRILEAMRARDIEAAQGGEISADKVLSYEVVLDGDVIREVLVRNYGDRRRLREITSAMRWTLEKMYEKTVSST